MTVKMMVGTVLVLVPTLLVTTWHGMREHQELEEQQVRDDVAQVAEAVTRSFESLDTEGPSAHQRHIARTVGNLDLVENVRVIAVDGTVSFSSSPAEVGRRLDRPTWEPCRGCHAPGATVTGSAIFEAPDGTTLYHQIFSIPNERACHTCHQPRYQELGQLLVSFDMSDVEDEMRQYRRAALQTVSLALLVAMGGIALTFHRLVQRPLNEIQRQMRRVEEGDFQLDAPVTSRDEIGQLYATFANMTKELAKSSELLERRVSEKSERVTALTRRLQTIDVDLLRLERLSAVGALSARVVHEVRTPLNALSLNLQLLKRELTKREDVGPALLELADNTKAEVERVNLVLARFLERARLPQAKTTLESFERLVRGVLSLFTADAEEAEVALTMRVPDDLPDLWLPADPFRQVLINLTSNALRACEPGDEVALVAKLASESRLQVDVRDTGEGIEPGSMDRIFDPFYTTRSDGTGLGLAIVRQIIEQVGGTLRVESVPGEGTCFHLEIPVSSNDEAEDEGPPA